MIDFVPYTQAGMLLLGCKRGVRLFSDPVRHRCSPIPQVHLIRLENLLAESEGGGPTQVDLAKIFKYHDLKSFEVSR